MSKMFTVATILALLFLARFAASQALPSKGITKYSGGHSTALEAVLHIAEADRIPLGITFGTKPRLCGQAQDFTFTGMTGYQALQHSLQGTGYTVFYYGGVYHIEAPDLSAGEGDVEAFKFESFESRPATMSSIGANLTGFITALVEGAGGYIGNGLSSTDDEIISPPAFSGLTAPQIANAIVKLGSGGLWIMQALKVTPHPSPGSTVISIFSYHDTPHFTSKITCVTPAHQVGN